MDNINLFNLPDDIMIEIFNLSADPAQLSSISKRFEKLFNEEFASNLFNDYRHQPHLKDLANKVNQDPQNTNAIQKVRALYTTLIGSTKEIEKGEKIRKESFQHYHNAIDPKRLDEIAEKLEIEEARVANVFFFQVLNENVPGFQLFTEEELRQQDEIFGTNEDAKEIFKVKKYKEWIDIHPDQVAQISNISVWDCDFIPKEIGKFTHANTIFIERGKIKKIPSEIGQLQEVINITISNTHIENIPPEISQLTKLAYLELPFNRITILPTEVGKLAELNKLNLHHNQIKIIPSEIAQLTKLTMLHLNSNQIANLPVEIKQLNLRLLDIRDNPLDEASYEMLKLIKQNKEWVVRIDLKQKDRIDVEE